MTTAAGHVRTGGVTVAAREAMTSAGRCHVGDVLGVVERDFVVVTPPGPEAFLETGLAVVRRMLSPGGELVTVVGGEGAPPDLAERLAPAIEAEYAGVDVLVLIGGQPRYPLLLGVE
jgi:dihydroxyacetone kinase-like predicted kinase